MYVTTLFDQLYNLILEVLYCLKWFNLPFAAVHVLDNGTKIRQQNITQALD